MTVPAFDTHAHLQDPAFGRDPGPLLERARTAGVAAITLCGYDERSNDDALRMAEASELLFPAVGFHPHEAGGVTAAMLTRLETLAIRDDVIAVGEIGLDFFRNHTSEADQRRVLVEQLDIALRVGKPVSLHTRAAEDLIHEQLAPYAESVRAAGRTNPGVMHCFGGTLEQAQRYVELGFLISIACPITYPRNDEARRLAAGLPLGSIVVETDSPYLPPQKLRGQRNEPANVRAAIVAIASARRATEDEIAAATTANAEGMFGVMARARTEIA